MDRVDTATVQTLTAEVRVLMVGSRQITLSVYRQLDWVYKPDDLVPFGRVRDRASVGVIGAHAQTGVLVRFQPFHPVREEYGRDEEALYRRDVRLHHEYLDALPLIVLAGLR